MEDVEEGVEPEPGVTAPLDETTPEEERELEPAGVMPGAGPGNEDPARERFEDQVEEAVEEE